MYPEDLFVMDIILHYGGFQALPTAEKLYVFDIIPNPDIS
jgi:hypothetical protein